jgi:hypothetical protein
MTKKDYILLAETIRKFLEDYDEEIDKETIRKFVTRLSRTLIHDNPDFDRQKFHNAIYPNNPNIISP